MQFFYMNNGKCASFHTSIIVMSTAREHMSGNTSAHNYVCNGAEVFVNIHGKYCAVSRNINLGLVGIIHTFESKLEAIVAHALLCAHLHKVEFINVIDEHHRFNRRVAETMLSLTHGA